MKIEDSQVIFSSGRKRYARRGLLAIEADPWFIFYGYDSGFWSQAQNEFEDDPLSADDLRELADYQIGLWTKFKESLQ